MIDKVFMRILMVLGMLFLVTLIDTIYDFKRKVSYNRYDIIRHDDNRIMKIDKQTGVTWSYIYSRIHIAIHTNDNVKYIGVI